jgi:sugar phosphate permease
MSSPDMTVTRRRTRFLTVTFYFLAWSFAYAIRYALGIVAPALMQAYHIAPKEMGYILSGWTWSYTAGLLFIGPLVDRLGPWIVTAVGSVVWGFSTLVIPLAGGPSSLFLLRLLFGLGHCVLIASSAVSVSHEFSGKERARAIASVYSGNQVGLAAGAMIAAFIFSKAGWEAVFLLDRRSHRAFRRHLAALLSRPKSRSTTVRARGTGRGAQMVEVLSISLDMGHCLRPNGILIRARCLC